MFELAQQRVAFAPELVQIMVALLLRAHAEERDGLVCQLVQFRMQPGELRGFVRADLTGDLFLQPVTKATSVFVERWQFGFVTGKDRGQLSHPFAVRDCAHQERQTLARERTNGLPGCGGMPARHPSWDLGAGKRRGDRKTLAIFATQLEQQVRMVVAGDTHGEETAEKTVGKANQTFEQCSVAVAFGGFEDDRFGDFDTLRLQQVELAQGKSFTVEIVETDRYTKMPTNFDDRGDLFEPIPVLGVELENQQRKICLVPNLLDGREERRRREGRNG